MREQTPLRACKVHASPWDRSRAEADDDSSPASDEARCGCDANKTSDHAIDSADDGGFAVEYGVHQSPGQHRESGAQVRVEDSHASVRRGGVGILQCTVSCCHLTIS